MLTLLCVDLDRAAAELDGDAGTRAALRRHGLASREYILLGWSLVLATSDDDDVRERYSRLPAARENLKFITANSARIAALLAPG